MSEEQANFQKSKKSSTNSEFDDQNGNNCSASNKFIITNNYFNNNAGSSGGHGKTQPSPTNSNSSPDYSHSHPYIDESKIIERIMESIGKIKDKKEMLDQDFSQNEGNGISKSSFIIFVLFILGMIYIAGKFKEDDIGL